MITLQLPDSTERVEYDEENKTAQIKGKRSTRYATQTELKLIQYAIDSSGRASQVVYPTPSPISEINEITEIIKNNDTRGIVIDPPTNNPALRININQALESVLVLLPGVDEKLAFEIVDKRKIRPFTDLNDLEERTSGELAAEIMDLVEF